MDLNRKIKIEEWVGKGAEWCANQLWNARKEAKEARGTATQYRNEAWKIRADIHAAKHIRKQNECLKDILEENGIHPTRLRLFYRLPDCEGCEYNPEYGGDGDCYDCNDDSIEMVSSTAWYAYEIKDGLIDGIVSSFNTEYYDCYKIVDERTGEVLYQLLEENDEE